MWIITRDVDAIRNGEPGCLPKSSDFREGVELPYDFRLLDGDGEVYFYGKSDDDSSFAPLDQFGIGWAGCTTIEYRIISSVFKNRWEAL